MRLCLVNPMLMLRVNLPIFRLPTGERFNVLAQNVLADE